MHKQLIIQRLVFINCNVIEYTFKPKELRVPCMHLLYLYEQL